MLSFYLTFISFFILISRLFLLPISTHINLRLLQSIKKWHGHHNSEIINTFQIIRIGSLKKIIIFLHLHLSSRSLRRCYLTGTFKSVGTAARGEIVFFPLMIFYSIRHHRLPLLLIGSMSIIVTYCSWSRIREYSFGNGEKCKKTFARY